jgi:hypothetical protein
MPVVKMDLSAQSYKELKSMMKKMKYTNEDLFLKYCVLKTVKRYATKADQKLIAEEIVSIQRTKDR